MLKQHNTAHIHVAEWVPLSTSIGFMMRRKRLIAYSLLLFVITVTLTGIGYLLTVDLINDYTGNFFASAPAADNTWGWIKHKGWLVSSWLFLIVSRIVAFYLAFLLAYSITTPGYVFLSTATEKLHLGEHFDPDASLTPLGILRDVIEGIKIAILGIVVTIIAIFINFIPGIGQAAVFLLYTYYSALMFIDYPASRRRWSFGQKIRWLQNHSSPAFRIGILPAFISMIPLLNIFGIALLFPILTIHTTLNFSAIEMATKEQAWVKR